VAPRNHRLFELRIIRGLPRQNIAARDSKRDECSKTKHHLAVYRQLPPFSLGSMIRKCAGA
jgi:hypothetical protein